MHLSVYGKFEPTVSPCLSRDLKVCAFELSVALQRRFNDCLDVFSEVNRVDNFNCCFRTGVKLDRNFKLPVGLYHYKQTHSDMADVGLCGRLIQLD